MMPEKENREKRYTIRLTEAESEILEQKMKSLGATNAAAFIRSMILDGYVLRLDLPEVREMIRLLKNMTNNLNQIARRVNQQGHIYDTEIEEIQLRQNELWELLNQLLAIMNGMN